MNNMILHCFIDYNVDRVMPAGQIEKVYGFFTFCGFDEKSVRNCADICSALLKQLHIWHKVAFELKPALIIGDKDNE